MTVVRLSGRGFLPETGPRGDRVQSAAHARLGSAVGTHIAAIAQGRRPELGLVAATSPRLGQGFARRQRRGKRDRRLRLAGRLDG